jgi:hypothetical protein
MTQAQYNIVDFKKIDRYSIPVFSSMPDQLKGSWMHITKVDLPKVNYVIGIYFNNKYPENTVVVSEIMPTEYPDLYATVNKYSITERVYITPEHRKKGLLAVFGLVGRFVFYKYINMTVDIVKETSKKNKKATEIFKLVLNEKIEDSPLETKSAASLFDIDPPRDPVYPNIWHEHRAGGKNG